MDGQNAPSENGDQAGQKPEKVKRGYRACLHCRSRKAKCDLGDIDAPSEPPCSRCRRESRECVFAPSRRGGNHAKRKEEDSSPQSQYGASIHDLIHRSPSSNLYPLHRPNGTDNGPPRDNNVPSSTPSPKRRRLHLNPPIQASDPSSIVVADMQNESDALQILAMASGHAGGKARETAGGASDLGAFPLIQMGIVNVNQVGMLADAFFQHHHHFFPLVVPDKIPKNMADLAEFSQQEKYLLTAAIIIASKHHPAPGMKDVHDKSWAVMRGWLSDIQWLGTAPTIGLIESLLLLAENLPRDPTRWKRPGPGEDEREDVHGSENRQAWMLIGMAIRCAYGLGIEKLAMKLFTESDRTPELERARLAWTYCYLFDRHISLRLGKAFWSRGPAVCFQGYTSSSQTGPAAGPTNFPSLHHPEGQQQDDYACLLQAYLELTQIMSTAHDTLWPNPARTKSLMIYGEYFKYLDELARSIDGFRILWGHKKWATFPLADCVAATLHYTTLVVTAFSFVRNEHSYIDSTFTLQQSHLERASVRAEREKGNNSSISLFPRGAAHSPDARYIFQSLDSARALLEICVNRLHPGGALRYLPWRYFLWFTYASVLLLKALYSGAMLRADHAGTLKLIDRLCLCFSEASTDEDHPAVRYGRQLVDLKKKLSVMSDSTYVNSPTAGGTVPLPTPPQPAVSPWSLPFASATPNISFSYPDDMGSLAPPQHQPMSEVYPQDPNLGFATLDDWFGQTTQDGDIFGGIDLQEFWFQVGPGEAQGGFPFR